MNERYQWTGGKVVSTVAALAVIGYLGSYTPSLLSWWEETWHPHGREPWVVNPGVESEPLVLTTPADPAEEFLWDESSLEEKGKPMGDGDWPFEAKMQFRPPSMARSVQDQEDATGV